ncbi:hypothetical protein BWQ96_06178 [Gracilariopsis chorda]|uniref:Cyclin-dependent kinase inhibitor domain-containing protein n=1 Tax=Gracilariopsis chorda TaxID=448386 RepID=A0A2V3IPW7_9FLOR|nr:hypothetical protein BWQ96_06178 [Gracilariopsis chorda]|eukprot:PXF44097.1 hypothetical protein BWQ96_06178 [Gracilariopsis chorda]
MAASNTAAAAASSSKRRSHSTAAAKRTRSPARAAPKLNIADIPPESATTSAAVDALRRVVESQSASRFREKWGFDIRTAEPVQDSNWQWQSPPHAD